MSTFSDIIGYVKSAVPELTNSSNASIWERLCQIFAGIIDVTNLNCANSEKVIENTARTLRVASKQYYVDISLAYQEGDNLVLLNPETYQYGYTNIDESKQIIKQVAVLFNQTNKNITLSVAQIDGTGMVTSITPEQLAAFASYIEFKTPLGIILQVVSNPAYVVGADTLIIRYDDSFSLDSIKSDIKDNLNNQQAVVRGASPLYVNDIEQSLRSINGVVDAYFENPYTYAPDTPDTKVSPIKGILQTQTGYFNFEQDLRDLAQTKVEFIIS